MLQLQRSAKRSRVGERVGLDPCGGGDLCSLGGDFATTAHRASLGGHYDQYQLDKAVLSQSHYRHDVIWDGGEGDPPLNTGFPLPGTTDYQLVFTVGTHDLDIISV
jgi:hypothetical protein